MGGAKDFECLGIAKALARRARAGVTYQGDAFGSGSAAGAIARGDTGLPSMIEISPQRRLCVLRHIR